MMYSFESNSDLNESNRELGESFRPYIIVLIFRIECHKLAGSSEPWIILLRRDTPPPQRNTC